MNKRLLPRFAAVLLAFALGSAHAQTWLEPGDRFVHRNGSGEDDAFVRGRLGVVLPSYGATSLYATYRVLMLPAGSLATESHERHAKPEQDGREAKVLWLDARAAVRRDAARPIDYYKSYGAGLQGVFGNCGGSAFETAAQTLADLRADKAVKSADIQAWVDGQDAVFDQCAWSADKGAAPALPADLPANASALLRALRRYQHAAALFYRGDFESARKEFDAVAADARNPMASFAALASLRCTLREATLNPDWDTEFRRAYVDQGLRGSALWNALGNARAQRQERNLRAEQRIEERSGALLKDARFARVHPLVQQLLVRSRELLAPSRAVEALFDQLDHLDQNPYTDDALHRWDRLLPSAEQSVAGSLQSAAARRAHPFYDWQMTLQGCNDDFQRETSNALCDAEHAHALARWQAAPNDAWLLAVLATARHAAERDLPAIEAARQAGDAVPAWLSLQYHAARALRQLKRPEEARAVADRALARSDLDASAANLLRQERFALATTVASALSDALRTSGTDPAPSAVAADAGMLFDDRLASDDLLALARDDGTPAGLRANLVAAAWFRADLAQRFEVAVPAAELTARLVPGLAATARSYAGAKSADDRRDALLQGVLTTQFSPKVHHDTAYKPGEPLARRSTPAADWCEFGGAREKFQQAVEHVPPLAGELHGGDAQPAEFAKLQAIGSGPAWFAHQALLSARRHPGEASSIAMLKAVVASSRNTDQLCPAEDAALSRDSAEQLLANPNATFSRQHVAEADVRKFYDEHPNLFARHKAYVLQVTNVQAPAAEKAEIVAFAHASHSLSQLTDWLKSKGLQFDTSAVNKLAEQIPMQVLDRIAALEPGQTLAQPQATGISAVTLVSAQSTPISLVEARPAIEMFIANQARRQNSQGKTD